MSIESEFKKFVGIAERIAVALEGRGVDDVYDDEVFNDSAGAVEEIVPFGVEPVVEEVWGVHVKQEHRLWTAPVTLRRFLLVLAEAAGLGRRRLE